MAAPTAPTPLAPALLRANAVSFAAETLGAVSTRLQPQPLATRLSAGQGHGYFYTPYSSEDRDGPERAEWLQQARVVGHRPLPRRATALIESARVSSFMGLLLDMHRAYVVSDDSLLLFPTHTAAPAQPGTPAGYSVVGASVKAVQDEECVVLGPLGRPIECVGVAVPRPGVYAPSVKFMLVVCTLSETLLFAVTFEGDHIHGRMHVHRATAGRSSTGPRTDGEADPRMSAYATLRFPTDGLRIVRVAGTANGRVLLAATDGCVHECVYDADTVQDAGGHTLSAVTAALGVAKRPRRVTFTPSSGMTAMLRRMTAGLLGATPSPLIDIAVDHERGHVYTLAADSSIQLYTLGEDGTALTHLHTLADIEAACAAYATRSMNTSPCRPDPSKFKPGLIAPATGVIFPLIRIAVMPVFHGGGEMGICLTAVSHTGARVFLSVQVDNSSLFVTKTPSLVVLGVRMPPPATRLETYLDAPYTADVPEGVKPLHSADAPTPAPDAPRAESFTDACARPGVYVLLPAPVTADAVGVQSTGRVCVLTTDFTRTQGGTRIAESVTSVALDGHVCACDEVAQPSASALSPPMFSPCGAVYTPDGDLCTFPWPYTRTYLDACSDVTVVQVHAGAKRPLGLTGGAMDPLVVQTSLTEAGVQPQHQHFLRARLWARAHFGATEAAPELTMTTTRTLCVLTSEGVYTVMLVRPRDQLARWLRTVGQPQVVDRVRALLRYMQGDEVIAQLTALACGTPDAHMLAATATFTGGSTALTASGTASQAAAPSALGDAAAAVLDVFKGTPEWSTNSDDLSPETLLYSLRLSGIFTYAGALLQPFWTYTLFMTPPGTRTGEKHSIILPRYSRDECLRLHAQLKAFLRVVTAAFPFCGRDDMLDPLAREAGVCGYEPVFEHAPSAEYRARRAKVLETVTIISLYRTLTRCMETAAFLSAIADPFYAAASVLQDLAKGNSTSGGQVMLVPDSKLLSSVVGTQFHAFVTNKDGCADAIAQGLVTRMLIRLTAIKPIIVSGAASALSSAADMPGMGGSSSRAGTGVSIGKDVCIALAAYLRTECPSFFTHSDQRFLLAERQLQSAQEVQSTRERGELIEKATSDVCAAVRACSDAPSLHSRFSRIERIMDSLAALSAFSHLLRVAADAGAFLASLPPTPSTPDVLPADAASSDLWSGLDAEPRTASKLRVNIYRRLCTKLAAIRNGDIGPSRDTAGDTFRTVLEAVLATRDALMHEVVYRWMMDAGMAADLTHVRSPYIEAFLAAHTSEDVDLRVAYYEHRHEFAKAAHMLAELCLSPRTKPLTRRITYMERACALAEEAHVGLLGGVHESMLSSWRDTLLLLSLQQRVLRLLTHMKTSTPGREEGLDAAIATLRDDVISLTDLYSRFAKQFELWDVCISILAEARQHDYAIVVREYWLALITDAVCTAQAHAVPYVQRTGRVAESTAASAEAHVRQCIRTLGLELYNPSNSAAASYAFPIPFLIHVCEAHACNDGWPAAQGDEYDHCWLSVRTLQAEVHVPWYALVDTYAKCTSEVIDDNWSPALRAHFLRAFTHLMRAWTNSIMTATAAAKAELLAHVRELNERLQSFKVSLPTLGLDTPAARTCERELEDARAALNAATLVLQQSQVYGGGSGFAGGGSYLGASGTSMMLYGGR